MKEYVKLTDNIYGRKQGMCSAGGEAEAQIEGGKQGLDYFPASSRLGDIAQSACAPVSWSMT